MLPKRREKIEKVVGLRQRGVIVVLEDIHDPHNAAAILRTCDAMGIQNVWFIFEKETPYNPKRIGKATSSSANKWIDFRFFDSTAQCICQLRRDGYSVLVTALTDTAISLTDHRFTEKKNALFIGNEHAGASETALKNADHVIKIPMAGFVQSLNVSVATAILLWEFTRQRRTSKESWMLTTRKQHKLLEQLLERAGK